MKNNELQKTQACSRGVLIVNCSQCERGRVAAHYATGAALRDAGVVAGADLTTEAALTKLAYVLGHTELSVGEKRSLIEENLRGELTTLTTPEQEEGAGVEGDRVGLFDSLSDAMHLTSGEERARVRDALAPSLICRVAADGRVGQLERIRLLGVDLTGADYDGSTALHVAAAEGREDVVAYLLERGASLEKRDRWGNGPLESAVNADWHAVIRLLRSSGAALQV